MSVREIVIGRAFDVDRLPPHLEHLECYTLLGANLVLVESKGKPPVTAWLKTVTGQIVCDCPQARHMDSCGHQQALSNGLWARLASLPPYKSLLTDTQDWCSHTMIELLALDIALLPQAVSMESGRE